MQISRPHGKTGSVVRLAAVLALVLVTIGNMGVAVASPGSPRTASAVPHVVPDWMSESTARQLDLGFDVLVPKSVPAPFAGEPSIQVGDDSYSLYWMVPGTPPTFLQITGEVGGEIAGAREEVRLECRDDPAARVGLAGGGERRADFRRMVGVIVHDAHAARLTHTLESPLHAAEEIGRAHV